MICPNCGTDNDDAYQFCMSCGKPLTTQAPQTPNQQPSNDKSSQPTRQPARPSAGEYSRKKDLLKSNITPADGEVSVRTYYCTYYKSRLLAMEASGYIGVTNKRVIFQALGSSNAGSSVIQSEVPIADVSGISSYKGTYFSIGHLLMALFASFLAAALTTSIVTVLGTIIGLVSQSFSALTAVGWLLAIGALIFSLGLPRETIWKTVLAGISAVAFSVAGGGSLISGFSRSILSLGRSQSSGSVGAALLAAFLAFCVGIYVLACIIWYARRPTFSLAINSKGGSSTPINITGASVLGLFDVSAAKALSAEPTGDSERMLEELGAVILDIQMLGDMGMEKWKSF